MYDFTFSYPNDAVSVLRNRTGVCAGFAALSTALLRAGGIPAQYVLGCATPFGYSTGPGGGFHGWVAAYYPDVGWVHSEPQVSANYLLPGAFIGEEGDLSYLAWCGNEATRIEQISVETNVPSGLWLRTPYPNGITDWSFIHAASIPAWRRSLLNASPHSISALLSVGDHLSRALDVVDDACNGETLWELSSDCEWLWPEPSSVTPAVLATGILSGTGSTRALLRVDATGLGLGDHSAILSLRWNWSGWGPDGEWETYRDSMTIPVRLRIVERVHRVFLPIVARR